MSDKLAAESDWITARLRVVSMVEKGLGPGSLAELRRLSPEEPGGIAFWRIAAEVLEPENILRGSEQAHLEGERQWAAILSILARLHGLHQPKRSLGAALAAARYSELRLTRLLRASGPPLWDAARTAAYQLASKGEAVDFIDIVDLIESDGRTRAERVRRGIARGYFANIDHS